MQNQQKSHNSSQQLGSVKINPEDGFPEDLDSYVEPDSYRGQPATFVPSKVPKRRIPPFMNILVEKHHITPSLQRAHVMARFNTLPDSDLNDIEAALDI